jgi:hypothetical protein
MLPFALVLIHGFENFVFTCLLGNGEGFANPFGAIFRLDLLENGFMLVVRFFLCHTGNILWITNMILHHIKGIKQIYMMGW